MKNKCPGSGKRVMLGWPPNTYTQPVERGEVDVIVHYAGGVVCPDCSVGLEVVHGTVKASTYPAPAPYGDQRWPCFIGTVRTHKRLAWKDR